MAWVYTGDLAVDSERVRFLLGDTNPNDQLLTEKEVGWLLDETPDIYLAAANGCDVIIAKLARDVDRNDIGMSATRSQQIQHYETLRDSLRKKTNSFAEPYVGGVSESENISDKQDTDLRQPAFTRHRNDNFRT